MTRIQISGKSLRLSFMCSCVSIASLFIGCGSSGPTMAPQRLTVNVPTITPQAETSESQEKGGVEISLAPVSYEAAVRENVTLQQVAAPPLSVVTGGAGVYVQRTSNSSVEVSPDHLRFVVKINNKMPRVFYGRGTIVQFNVGGRLRDVDQSGYINFLGMIIPPQQEKQIEIVGPRLSTLADKEGIVGVFLYDVVTKQDDAGAVTEKQNFQWFFDYKLQPVEKEAVTTTQKLWIPYEEFRQEMTRQHVEATQKMLMPVNAMQAYPPVMTQP